MTKLFWIAGLAAVLGGGAVASAPTGAGPVGGSLNPGEHMWAATTGNPDDLEDRAVSEERASPSTSPSVSVPALRPPAPAATSIDGG
jgi:hypothetical protein